MRRRRWDKIALNLMLIAALAISAYIVGPAIETKFFPVYGKFELIDVKSVNGSTVGQFSYEKLRPCEAQGFAWFAGEFGATSRQVEVLPVERRSTTHPVGFHLTVPYVFVGASPEQVKSSMRAEIYNRCHPFWVSRTEIYP